MCTISSDFSFVSKQIGPGHISSLLSSGIGICNLEIQLCGRKIIIASRQLVPGIIGQAILIQIFHYPDHSGLRPFPGRIPENGKVNSVWVVLMVLHSFFETKNYIASKGSQGKTPACPTHQGAGGYWTSPGHTINKLSGCRLILHYLSNILSVNPHTGKHQKAICKAESYQGIIVYESSCLLVLHYA